MIIETHFGCEYEINNFFFVELANRAKEACDLFDELASIKPQPMLNYNTNESKYTTPHEVLRNTYRTASRNRLTSQHEFNRDGGYMVALKEIWYDTLEIARDAKTNKEQCVLESDLILAFMKNENKRLEVKHWGKGVANG